MKAEVPVSTGAVAMLRSGLKYVPYWTETFFPSAIRYGLGLPAVDPQPGEKRWTLRIEKKK
jgi:hypothetical protein